MTVKIEKKNKIRIKKVLNHAMNALFIKIKIKINKKNKIR